MDHGGALVTGNDKPVVVGDHSQDSTRSIRGLMPSSLEMAELRDALDDAMAGQGRSVMLAGEPGIGKTRTAQELGSHATALGAKVLWGWCYEREGAPP